MLQFLCIVFGCDAIILTGRLCFFPLETNKADFIFPMSPEIVFTAELFCFSPKKTESEKVDERDDDVDDETSKYMFQNFLSPVNRFAQRIAIDWATALARSFDYNFWHKNEVQKFWRRRRGHVEAEWVGAVSRISDSLRTIIAPP